MGIQDHQHHRGKQDQTPHKPHSTHWNSNLPPQKHTENHTQKASSHRHQTTASYATPPYPSVIPTNTRSPALHRLIRLWFRFGKEAPMEAQLNTNKWTFEAFWYQVLSQNRHGLFGIYPLHCLNLILNIYKPTCKWTTLLVSVLFFAYCFLGIWGKWRCHTRFIPFARFILYGVLHRCRWYDTEMHEGSGVATPMLKCLLLSWHPRQSTHAKSAQAWCLYQIHGSQPISLLICINNCANSRCSLGKMALPHPPRVHQSTTIGIVLQAASET